MKNELIGSYEDILKEISSIYHLAKRSYVNENGIHVKEANSLAYILQTAKSIMDEYGDEKQIDELKAMVDEIKKQR